MKRSRYCEPTPTGLATEVVEGVARAFGLTPKQIFSGRKQRRIARARQVSAWVLCRGLRKSTTQAGRSLGRDHSTILHAIRLVDADPALMAVARAIAADVGARETVRQAQRACIVDFIPELA